ncbi:MAG: hypothetical protein JNM57_00600 [Cyclobacteriaceae bacterium]|nr:hypothetical protein [Cyclobacteriaceae bacterium]
MKSLVLGFMLLLGGLVVHGQQAEYFLAYHQSTARTTISPMLLKSESVFQDGFKIPGERMKRTGSTLTVIGGALFIGGIILTSQGSTEYDPYTGYEVADEKLALGVTMLVVGTGMLVPGIIFWSKGAKKYNRYMEQQQSLSFKVRGPALSLAYRF